MRNALLGFIAGILLGLVIILGSIAGKQKATEEGLSGPSGPIYYVTHRSDNGYLIEEADEREIRDEDLATIRQEIKSGTNCALGGITVMKYDPATGKALKIWIEVLGKKPEELPPQIQLLLP